MAEWADEEEEFEDEDFEGGEFDDEEFEDEFEPVMPVHRAVVPGRNDPCWCGSGKKYKKCHLESDEQTSRGGPAAKSAALPRGLDGLRERIGEFVTNEVTSRNSMRVFREFFGEAGSIEETEATSMMDWLVHDYKLPGQTRTLLEEYLARNGARLDSREREMAVAWSKSCVSLWEAQEVKPGAGVAMKNLLSGESVFVNDVNLSRQVVKWDVGLMRVLPGERGMESTGTGIGVARHSVEPFRRWLETERAKSGLEWTAFLKRELPRIRREAMALHERWRENLQLRNTSGEDLVFGKARYRFSDTDGVLRALRKCRELHGEPDESEFVWMNKGKTILGRVALEAGSLTLECNSRERLERGKSILAEAAGDLLTHEGDEFTDVEEVNRRGAAEAPKERERDEIPKEIRDQIVGNYLEKHYETWPDTKLPALDGKTPLQAAKTAAGRAKLEAVLKFIENGEARKQRAGEPFYDVGRLRARLGLKN